MTTPLYELKNLEMKGGLATFLKSATADGKSVREIATALSKKGTTVSTTTVHRWLTSQPAGKQTTTKQRRNH